MKNFLLLLTIFSNVVFADLVDLYRSQGLEAVKSQLEKEMTRQAYWEKYLQDKNVDYGYYESKKICYISTKRSKRDCFI